MAIITCDICDKQNVPGSHGQDSTGCDVTQCYVCAGDEFDPYCELEDFDWTLEFWRPGETDEEHEERVAAVRKDALWYFNKATARQNQEYRDAISVMSAYHGAPRWHREFEATQRKFDVDTKDARLLFQRTAIALMKAGEVPSDLDAEWTAMFDLAAVREVMEAAE